MKTHHPKPQSKTRSALLSLALGVTLLGSGGGVQAENLLINTFDTDVSGFAWQNWRSYVLSNELVWDGTQDADGNAGSGSMHTMIGWPTTDHPTFSSGWNDVQVAFASPVGLFTNSDYLEVEVFIKIDVTNSSTAVNGQYGAMEIILNGGTGGWSGVGYTTIKATNGWQRIHGPLPGLSGASFNQVALMFMSNGGDVMTNTVNFWVDNIRFIAPPSVNTNRPALNIAKPPPAGLTCMTTAAGNAWQRQMVRTVNTGYSWHTANAASNTTTYALTVGAIPGGANAGFEAMMYLIPETGMSNPDGGSVDWDSANVAYFVVNANGDGTGKANFRYKTNNPGGENFQSWTDHTCVTGPLGTWQLAFNNNTNVTITAPDATTTSLIIPEDAAANFQGGLIAYLGTRPAGASRIGQSATYSRMKITGASATIDDTFGTLDPATWVKKADSPQGVFITASDAKYWLTWLLPDSGFTNVYVTDDLTKNVALGQWLSLPASATGWLNVAGASRLAVVNQSALNTAFSYTPSNCFFQLFHP